MGESLMKLRARRNRFIKMKTNDKAKRMNYIVITGAAGFIGSHVAGLLAARGTHKIVAVDTLGDGDKWRNLAHHNITEIVAPGNLFYWLEMYGEQTDAVIHLASASAGETDVDVLADIHLGLSVMLWKWCAENQVRFLYAATGATYGAGAQGVKDESSPAYLEGLRPETPFAWTKHRFDCYVANETAGGGDVPPQWAGLKLFHVYGPNEYHKGAHASAVTRLLSGAGAPDASLKQDFIYVKDAAEVFAWLLDNAKISGLFNVGSGQLRSVEDAAKLVGAKIAAGDAGIVLPQLAADIGKLRQAGYNKSFATLEQGIADYAGNYWNKTDRYY